MDGSYIFFRKPYARGIVDENPFLFQVLSLVGGMIASYYLLSFIVVSLYVILILMGFIFLFFVLWNIYFYKPFSFDLSFFLSVVFCFLLGFFLFQFRIQKVVSSVVRPQIMYGARVEESPTERERTWRVPITLSDGGKVIMFLSKKGTDSCLVNRLRVGASVHFSAWRTQTTNPRDTKNWQGNERLFKPYYDYLFAQGFSAVCFVNSTYISVDTVAHGRKNISSWRKARIQVLSYYRKKLPDTQPAAVIEAMTMGDKTHLDSALRTSFSRAGMAHLLALSGFHLSVVVMFIHAILFTSRMRLWYLIVNILVVIPSMWAYTILVGCPPSLVRAALMSTFFIVGEQFNSHTNKINILLLALIVMLCANPFLLLDLGMQLSFISVLGIILLGLPLCRHLNNKPWLVRSFFSLVFISVSCSLYTAPLLAYHFGYIPLYAVVSNLLSSLFSMLLMWMSVLWWLSTPFSFLQDLLTPLFLFFPKLLCKISEIVSLFPGSFCSFHLSVFGVVVFYVLIGLLTIMIVRFLLKEHDIKFND